jgi:hypothetical protein
MDLILVKKDVYFISIDLLFAARLIHCKPCISKPIHGRCLFRSGVESSLWFKERPGREEVDIHKLLLLFLADLVFIMTAEIVHSISRFLPTHQGHIQ